MHQRAKWDSAAQDGTVIYFVFVLVILIFSLSLFLFLYLGRYHEGGLLGRQVDRTDRRICFFFFVIFALLFNVFTKSPSLSLLACSFIVFIDLRYYGC